MMLVGTVVLGQLNERFSDLELGSLNSKYVITRLLVVDTTMRF